MTSWFEVDKAGLARLVERRGKAVALLELLQNAWDAPGVTTVNVRLTAPGQSGLAILSVEDDSPKGFLRMDEAYTLFAPSKKVTNPELRGRFNLGEKLAFALADAVSISSTRGRVKFSAQGRRSDHSFLRDKGTLVTLQLHLTSDEQVQILEQARRCLPPAGIVTTINGQVLPAPTGAQYWDALQTEVADEGGVLRRETRQARVDFIREDGKRAWLFEMGIPVVKLGLDEPWSVNVHQKIPLTLERDNVRPSYMKRIRELVLEHMGDQIHGEVARRPWVTAALPAAPAAVVRHVVTARFGNKAVIADPSDPEGENLAKAQGYTVVAGGSFDGAAWEAVKAAGALLPAGQVTPSPKPFSPDGEPLQLVDSSDWTPGMSRFADLAGSVFHLLGIGGVLTVAFTLDRGWRFSAAYGQCALTVNAGTLDEDFFIKPWRREDRIRLLIHEFAHHHGHHLEEGYHRALERFGARLVEVALTDPSKLEMA
jgi:hypothetical protein